MDLAQSDRQDQVCVQKLVAEAEGNRKTLRMAAASVRFAGLARESRVRDRANRLLLAATTGDPVTPLSPELNELFSRIEDLYSVRVETAYSVLLRLSPEFGLLDTRLGQMPSTADEDSRWNELLEGLALLVGPDADADDPLLRSAAGTTYPVYIWQ